MTSDCVVAACKNLPIENIHLYTKATQNLATVQEAMDNFVFPDEIETKLMKIDEHFSRFDWNSG